MSNIFSSIAHGLLPGVFGGGATNPADVAMPYLDQIPEAGTAPLRPYQEGGEQALGRSQDIYEELLSDPGALMSRLGEGFQQSPGYQYNLSEALRGATSAAATGGMLGTPAHQVQSARIAGDVANQGYQDYLRNVLGLYGTGVSGEQHLADMGAGVASNLSDLYTRNLLNQSGLAFQGQTQQNQARADQLGNLMGALGAGASFFF